MMRPPKWLYQLFRFFSTVNRPDLEGDFLELYEQELSTKSRWRVNLKWTFNCIGLWPLKLIVRKENLRKPVLFNQNLHLMLLKNYSITALRSFRKTKLLTSLPLGRAVSAREARGVVEDPARRSDRVRQGMPLRM